MQRPNGPRIGRIQGALDSMQAELTTYLEHERAANEANCEDLKVESAVDDLKDAVSEAAGLARIALGEINKRDRRPDVDTQRRE